jgi:2-dehydro-3-deoxyphosphooctonate aldolase (KDO 8-P synthase)
MKQVAVTDSVVIGGTDLVLLGGPCAIESEEVTLRIGEGVAEICRRVGVPYVFKASFDKANRTSIDGYRGPGLENGLAVLQRVKQELGVPLVTDIHETWQAKPVAEVVDILQIPAFLCRQTDLLLAAAATGRVVNVKKGQFASPPEMEQVVRKLEAGGTERILLTERGSSFGHNALVVDFRGLPHMRTAGYPVVFDATHSVQMPAAQGTRSGGQRQFVPFLARAAVAVGIDALFMEIHEDPDRALSDGPNMLRLDDLERLLTDLVAIRAAAAMLPPTS